MVAWSTASTVALLAKPVLLADTVHPVVSDVLEASRAIRVLRVISVFPRLRVFVAHLGQATLLAFQLGVLYVAVTYSFALVGMFGFAVRCCVARVVRLRLRRAVAARLMPRPSTPRAVEPQHANPDDPEFACECSQQDYSFATFNYAMLALFQITVGCVSELLAAVPRPMQPASRRCMAATTAATTGTPYATR